MVARKGKEIIAGRGGGAERFAGLRDVGRRRISGTR